MIVLSMLFYRTANANQGDTPYVDGSISFVDIENVNRQAETWAMCAAAYDVMAEILADEKPAQSQYLSELANGAEVAVIMAIVLDGLDKDTTQNGFNALWSMAKLSGTELPKTRLTMLAAEAELYAGKDNGKDKNKFLENLTLTFEICIKNLEGQQMYVDAWRSLAKSGLLELPNE